MQRRYPLAALAAIGLVAAAGPAHAEPSVEPTPETATASDLAQAQAQSETITLPTGDQVRLTADGSYLTEPVTGGADAFHTTVEPDGDRLVIPVQALPQIADGELAMEQFNIDALARHGITDAGAPEAATLLEAEARAEAESSDGDPALVEVDFTGLWSDGSAPDLTYLRWMDVDTGEFGDALFEGGTGTLEMAPGHHHMVLSMDDYEASSSILTILDLHIDADPEPIVVDGADEKPVGFALDRETVRGGGSLTAFSYLPGTAEGLRGGASFGMRWTATVIPTEWDTSGRDVGLSLRQELTSPEGAEEPYSYSLYHWQEEGIPADPVFRVSDDELARVEMDYDSLGVDAVMRRLNLPVHPLHPSSGYLVNGPVDLPSKRTEFYTADPDMHWSHIGILGSGSEDGQEADVLHYSGALEPGSVTETGWNQGPVTVGLDLAGADYYLPRMYRWEGEGMLLTNPQMFSSGSPDEAVNNYETPGQTILSRDGLGVNKSAYGGSLATELALVPEGRYDLYAEAFRDVPWTTLGTASTAEWNFATAPAEDDVVLPVSVVNFDAKGIENGYADADATQRVTLKYTTQPGAEQQRCTAMTFEVSYDDGQTWTPVAIDRKGNRATARLTHPEGAEFVSVRFTATDKAGNTVTHSTIRSYGLE